MAETSLSNEPIAMPEDKEGILALPLEQRDDIIVCENVHKWFGEFCAVRDVSMTVKRGEVVVIFGPSGSGKSTFIRMINRLEEHQQGRIVVDGIEMTNDVRNLDAIRREVGMVFQQFNLFPHMTAVNNIMLAPQRVRHVPRREAEELPRCSCSNAWAFASRRTNTPPSYRAASSSGSPSPARSPCSRRSCCSMSRPRRSIRK